MTYTFDNAGKRATMVETVGTTSYSYDADSHLTSLENPYSETTSLSYDAASRLTQKTFVSGMYDTFGYDSRNRVTSLAHKNSSGTTISSESYSYDSASNMTSKTVDSLTTSYAVDAANQLLTENNTGYSSVYTYDANGNRASQDLNGTTYNYNYDSGDKLQTVKVGGTTVKSYGYDAAGRRTSVVTGAGTTSLSYDYEDRVSGITYPSTATNSFTYNGLDTRVGKVDSTGTYTYKRDGADVTNPVLSDGSIAYTPACSERKSSATTFDHADYIGTFTRQTNSSQSTTATRVYDSFGNLESTTGSPQSPFGFVGHEGYQEDGDSGLKLLGHRYYDPTTGRFLTRDPAGDGRNWFQYAESCPVSLSDPTGLWPGDPFPTMVAAARDAARYFGGSKRGRNHPENGGWIYMKGNKYSYTQVTQGNIAGVNFGPKPPNTVGSWHTHPIAGLPYPGSPGYFTGPPTATDPTDQNLFNGTIGPSFVIQPGGKIQMYPGNKALPPRIL